MEKFVLYLNFLLTLLCFAYKILEYVYIELSVSGFNVY